MKPPEPDAAFEISLRPPMFSEFTGQVKVRERLELMVEAAKKRCDVLFSRIIRAHGRCVRCGSVDNLQCAHVISRRFVNTVRVIFAIRMNNLQNYMQHFGSDGIRVLVDGLPTAPIDGPNETVAGGSSSPLRDFVFDLPTQTERVVLRATLDDAVSEKPFSLGQ